MNRYYMSVQKVFEFEDKNGKSLFLHGKDRLKDSESKIILNQYVNWYNTEFIDETDYSEVTTDDFKFIRLFMPVDFYEETKYLLENQK